MGDNVSAITAESTTAIVTTMPNSRNRRPTIPPMNSSGMNTAIREMVMDTMVKPISCEPMSAAVTRSRPCSR